MGPTLGDKVPARDGLVLDCFLGTAWSAVTGEVLDAVQDLIDHRLTDPAAIRGISRALREIRPSAVPSAG